MCGKCRSRTITVFMRVKGSIPDTYTRHFRPPRPSRRHATCRSRRVSDGRSAGAPDAVAQKCIAGRNRLVYASCGFSALTIYSERLRPRRDEIGFGAVATRAAGVSGDRRNVQCGGGGGRTPDVN